MNGQFTSLCLPLIISRLPLIPRLLRTLQTLLQAIRGEVVVTEDLMSAINAVYDARVPRQWVFSYGGDEISWMSASLGLWFSSFTARNEQLADWLSGGRPSCFWLTGFFNPQVHTANGVASYLIYACRTRAERKMMLVQCHTCPRVSIRIRNVILRKRGHSRPGYFSGRAWPDNLADVLICVLVSKGVVSLQ